MNDDPWRPRKVVIVGAGAVGSTFAYALAQSGLADEIALRDANHELAWDRSSIWLMARPFPVRPDS